MGGASDLGLWTDLGECLGRTEWAEAVKVKGAWVKGLRANAPLMEGPQENSASRLLPAHPVGSGTAISPGKSRPRPGRLSIRDEVSRLSGGSRFGMRSSIRDDVYPVFHWTLDLSPEQGQSMDEGGSEINTLRG